MRFPVALAAALLLSAPSSQARRPPRPPPKPLVATVERVPVEPAVVVVEADAGATTYARYRAAVERKPGALPSRKPLTLIVRLEPFNSPDLVDVTADDFGRRQFGVALDVRRFTGPLAANVVTTPYVEVALGELASGRYHFTIQETVREFADLQQPTVTTAPRAGRSTQLELEVK